MAPKSSRSSALDNQLSHGNHWKFSSFCWFFGPNDHFSHYLWMIRVDVWLWLSPGGSNFCGICLWEHCPPGNRGIHSPLLFLFPLKGSRLCYEKIFHSGIKIILSCRQMRINRRKMHSSWSFPYLTKGRNFWDTRTAIHPSPRQVLWP